MTESNGYQEEGEEVTSLLTVIIDMNALAWSTEGQGSFQLAMKQLFIFINAHLALDHRHQLSIVMCSSQHAQIVFPRPPKTIEPNKDMLMDMDSDVATPQQQQSVDPKPATAFTDFYRIDSLLQTAIQTFNAQSSTSLEASQVASALSLALAYTNRMRTPELKSRIFVLSVSQDGPAQYVSMMNCIFAAQSQGTLVDVCRIGSGSSVFLSQASSITGGVYLENIKLDQLVQHLLHIYLPDVSLRNLLCVSGNDEIDFRASCFCHKKHIDIGYVCSVCLSVYCSVQHECGTCHQRFV